MARQSQALTLKASAAVTAPGTVTGDAAVLEEVFDEATFMLDVTAAATDNDDTLDVYIDASPDGGTTWLNVAHFTQVLGNGGAKREVATVKANPAATAPIAVAAAAAAGAVRPIGFFDRVRYRSVIVDPDETDDVSFTFSVKAFFK